MIDIMNKKSYRPDDDVFFIISSVDKPHLFVKCSGVVVKKHSKKDNVMYLLQLKKIYISVHSAKTHLHRRTFKTRKDDSNIAVMKKLYCMEFFDNPESLSQNVCDIMKHHLFVIPSVFVADNYYDIEKLHSKAIDVIQDKLQKFLFEIES